MIGYMSTLSTPSREAFSSETFSLKPAVDHGQEFFKKIPAHYAGIIDETITFLLRRTDPDFAVEKAEILLSTDVIHTLRSDQEDEQEALEILKRYKDQKLSFTDCITSALMKRYKIDSIFTFDSHFRLFGYHVL